MSFITYNNDEYYLWLTIVYIYFGYINNQPLINYWFSYSYWDKLYLSVTLNTKEYTNKQIFKLNILLIMKIKNIWCYLRIVHFNFEITLLNQGATDLYQLLNCTTWMYCKITTTYATTIVSLTEHFSIFNFINLIFLHEIFWRKIMNFHESDLRTNNFIIFNNYY